MSLRLKLIYSLQGYKYNTYTEEGQYELIVINDCF